MLWKMYEDMDSDMDKGNKATTQQVHGNRKERKKRGGSNNGDCERSWEGKWVSWKYVKMQIKAEIKEIRQGHSRFMEAEKRGKREWQ